MSNAKTNLANLMLKLIGYNFKIAYEAILQNKIRAALTSLGIICGVASVIAMLSIGKGAEQEILEKMRLLGTSNIIIKPIEKKSDSKTTGSGSSSTDNTEDTKTNEEDKEKKKFSPGLSLKDANSIREIIPGIEAVSVEVVTDVLAFRDGLKRNISLVGANAEYFSVNNFTVSAGNLFLKSHIDYSEEVCVIGSGIKSKLFPGQEAVGKMLKCGNNWLKVIGVVEEKSISKENVKNLGIRDYNYDIYIPVTTMLLRYLNRENTKFLFHSDEEETEAKNKSYNQLDRIIVKVTNTEDLQNIAETISRMLTRRHNQVVDYEIVVPELLLEQEQRTKRIFNIVLGAIASISLLVGGIGIMNIMLASVLERTKEIGIRRAVGAKQRDIMLQFLTEAIAISVTGGLIGVIVGLILSFIIEKATGIVTIATIDAVMLSFLVSISVGLIFGITPAKKASKQDPIDLLRYE